MLYFIYNNMTKYDNDKFIEKSKLKHNDKYDYSLVEYKTMKTKVKIVCKNGHIFEQTPDNHLKGKGCRFCFGLATKHTLESFIIKSISKHGDRYNYSMVNYVDNKTKVSIICKDHGEFTQIPNLHMSKSGCPKCYHKSMSLSTNDFIKRSNVIHNNKYLYGENIINNRQKINIICPIHGTFKQSVSTHLSGSGCKECMRNKFRKGFDYFKDKAIQIHDNKYTYYEDTYLDMKSKIKIRCNTHGDFWMIPDNHISKSYGCPKCGLKYGILENDWLDRTNIDIKNRQIKIGKYLVDGFDPKTNTVYEFNGDFFHGNPEYYKNDDINSVTNLTFGKLYKDTIKKEKYLKSIGYNVVSIWESEYNIQNNYPNRYKKLIKS